MYFRSVARVLYYIDIHTAVGMNVFIGAAVAAAMKISEKSENNSTIVVAASDGGEKYLSLW